MQDRKMFFKDGASYVYGYFVRTVWRDEKTGGSCFLMNTEEEPPDGKMHRGETLTYDPSLGKDVTYFTLFCDAKELHVPLLEEYVPILAAGVFKTDGHDAGRMNFAISSLEEAGSRQLMVNYLVRTFGISGARAFEILKVLGDDPFSGSFADDAAEKIEASAGLSRRKAMAVITSLRKSTSDRELFNRLAPYGVTYGSARKAVQAYGAEALARLVEHPWEHGMACGMTLKQCDAFAFGEDRTQDDQERVQALCRMTEKSISSSGHVWCPSAYFTDVFRKYAGEKCTSTGAMDAKNVTFCTIGGTEAAVFSGPARAEARIAGNVFRLCGSTARNFSTKALPDVGVAYSEQQKRAFTLAETAGIKVLTGGPGTGKTTTIRGIVRYFQDNSDATVRLAAPTGRAAQRLSEVCGMDATTVHQLLEYRPYGEETSHKDRNDPIDAGLIVIDEMSMMNAELFDLLLEAVKTDTTLLLSGDIAQLEPIGPGAVFRDLMFGGKSLVENVWLTEVFRQGSESLIVRNANLIHGGNVGLVRGKDFEVIRTESSKDALERIVESVKAHHDPKEPFRCQVLCPVRKGDAGVSGLNARLQKELNPDPGGERLHYGSASYGRGDKILMTKNNYDMGYFNGDVGTVLSVDRETVSVTLRGETFTIHRSDLAEMSLAYAMTVHKSQGSEYRVAVISLPQDSPNMLVRSLFYTAVTRAKEKVIVVTEGDAMERAILTESPKRNTFLEPLLMGDRGGFPEALR